MSTSKSKVLFKQLAELARANSTNPLGHKLVAQAQRRLVKSMREQGLINEEDEECLAIP